MELTDGISNILKDSNSTFIESIDLSQAPNILFTDPFLEPTAPATNSKNSRSRSSSLQIEVDHSDEPEQTSKYTARSEKKLRSCCSSTNNESSNYQGINYLQKPFGFHEGSKSDMSRKFSESLDNFESTLDGTEGQLLLFKDLRFEKLADRERMSGHGSVFKNPQSNHNLADKELSGLIATRFEHVMTDEGHAVITGGELRRCEDEPIHIPGAIQSFGMLIALHETESGKFVIRIVSENSSEVVGYTPQELFQLDCFTDILVEEQRENLLDHINFIRSEAVDPSVNGPEVFTISVKVPPKKSKNNKILWCAMHIHPSQSELIICEFELDNDSIHPLAAEDHAPSELPEDTLKGNPTEIEYAENTRVINKPLRIFSRARKRKGEATAIDIFNTISQIHEQLASAPDLHVFFKILAGIVKELTGFHRVMIYQFDATYNGRVVSELVDSRVTHDLYKGLNFPASDIPQQARDLYKVNKVRLLYDRESVTARLVCRSKTDLEKPLDLSYSYLRALSPIHIKYLANMAVRSSMSISINSLNHLWGLVACHAYGSQGTRVSFPMRQMCRLIGDAASRNVERLFCVSRLQTRKLFSTSSIKKDTLEFIVASTDDLLRVFDSDFGLLSIQGETKIMGEPKNPQEAFAVQKYLGTRKVTSVISSQDIGYDFPDLKCPTGFEDIAGLLMVPLSIGGSDFILFFRKGQVLEVKWAGNPHDKKQMDVKEGHLEPRKSFKVWRETVIGKCREWTDEQVEAAAVLCLTFGKFIEIWRQKEESLPQSKLTKLLLANSAHEFRTPLNATINYLEIAMEGTLDQETRDNLGQSYHASKSLIYVINDLLDLTKTEVGQELVRDEVFDLPTTILDVTGMFTGDAKRKKLSYTVELSTEIPKYVIGDQWRVRQTVVNLIANAMQFTTEGFVRVSISLQCLDVDKARIMFEIEDSGCGMSDQDIEDIFTDLEHVVIDSKSPEERMKSPKDSVPQKREKKKLGLGLAMVSRIVGNMNGKLRLKSEEGIGSCFIIELSFDLPDLDENSKLFEDQAFQSTSSLMSINSDTDEISPVKDFSLPVMKDPIQTPTADIESNNQGTYTSSSRERDGGKNLNDKVEKKSTLRNTYVSEEEIMDLKSQNGSHFKRQNLVDCGSYTQKNAKLMFLSANIEQDQAHLLENMYDESRPLGKSLHHLDKYQSANRSVPSLSDISSYKSTNLSVQKFELESSVVKTQMRDIASLRILLAEDDPVNMKIFRKRLGKCGHEVYHTINGAECADVYAEKKLFFDVILMDMQMPTVDGMTSTKMIRSYEISQSENVLSTYAASNGRVPIFAVSASLVEAERNTYINTGFDGWILKPIDFKRLNTLLRGIFDTSVRDSCLYRPGQWEKGGWFNSRQPKLQ